MALVIYWYNFLCFVIVGSTIIGSLWLISRKERGGASEIGTKSENLLPRVQAEEGELGGWTHPSDVGSDILWMSCWRCVHPRLLLVTRLTSALVMILLLALDLSIWSTDFIYYTEWTFALVIVYFVAATVVSGYGCWVHSKRQGMNKERSGSGFVQDSQESNSTLITFSVNENRGAIKLQSHYKRGEFEQRVGFPGYAIHIAYQACAGSVMITDIVFWGLILPFLKLEHFQLNPLMICMHSLNAAFLLLDSALNRLSFPWFRIAYFLLFTCIYVIFQWVIHACGFPWWPYPFIELSSPWASLWYFVLALVHIPCYGLYVLIIKVKNVVFSKFFPYSFIKSC